MKSFNLSLFILLISSQINPQTFDLLKDYQPGQSIIYDFNRSASPSWFQDTTSTINIFDGTYRAYIDSINFSFIDSINTYHLKIHKVGTEVVQNKVRIISTKNIDTLYNSSITEYITNNFRSGEHRIKGWLFPDTVYQSPRCPDDTTIFYPYSNYYRFYYFPSTDTFDIRGDTLLLTNLATDCMDVGYTAGFRITINDGLVKRTISLFNFFDWSYTDVFNKVEVSEIENESPPPDYFKLYQNYPNPFNPVTTIKYSVPNSSHISLVVYDLMGRKVKTLVNEEKLPGYYTSQFDGTNLSSGVYFYVMKAANFIKTKKSVLIK